MQFAFIRDKKSMVRITALCLYLLAEVFIKVMNVSVASHEESICSAP